MKKLILISFFLLSILSNAQSSDDSYAKSAVLKIGDSFPNFTYFNKEGKSNESSKLKGKVILINFFATWCGPCMVEMPLLQKEIWEKYKSNDNFKLISFGRDHSLKEVNDFIKMKSFDFEICPDKGKLIYNQFATQYIPRNYLIDKDGKVIYVSVGYSEEDFKILKEKIKSLL
nr:TlpA disulfide reductase family protein [uncultured Flavobacterium sp.]